MTNETFRKIIWIIVALAICGLCWTGRAGASTPEYFNRVTDAIYRGEGSEMAKKPFGILSVPCYDYETCRVIAYNTVRNNYRRWQAAGEPGEYLDFLANRYCPEAVDPAGNKNWKRNIRSLLK